jgi:hypothetical protein
MEKPVAFITRRLGFDELRDLLFRDVVELDERPPDLGVPFPEPLAHPDDGGPRPVPGPGEQDVVSLQPLEPRIELEVAGRERRPHMDGGVHVRERERDEHLLLPCHGVGLEDVLLVPHLQPVLLAGGHVRQL